MPQSLQILLLPLLLLSGLLLPSLSKTLAEAQMAESAPENSLENSGPENSGLDNSNQPEPSPSPSESTASPSLEQLPTGQYYYNSPQASSKRPSFVLLRKSGRTVIGWDHRGAPACFRGFASGNQIINTTRILAPYQPDSELQQGQTLDLSDYHRIEHAASEAEAEALRTCIGVFWR